MLMHPDLKEKTAVISHTGLYQVCVLSFGLTGAPPQFQLLMARVTTSCAPHLFVHTETLKSLYIRQSDSFRVHFKSNNVR